jgi:tetratricopeptide (TPR) repeat protein
MRLVLALLLLASAAHAAAPPADYAGWLALGKLRQDEGKPGEAESALKRALALKPGDAAAEMALADVYEETGRFQEELSLLRERVRRDPRDFSLFALAHLYIRLGRVEDARKTFAQARRIPGKETRAYIAEGYFELHSDHQARAESAFASAIAVDTGSPFGYHHMGAFLSENGRYADAEAYFRRALERLEADPHARPHDLLHTRMWLGETIESQGRHAEAEEVLLRCLETAPPGDEFRPHLLRSLAMTYVSEGKTAKAEEIYARAVDECAVGSKCAPPDAVTALIARGRFELAQGRRKDAEAMEAAADAASRNLASGEDLFSVLRELAGFEKSLGEDSRAEAIHLRLLPFLRAMPFDPGLVWVATGLAAIDSAKGSYVEAEDYERRAISALDHDGRWKSEAEALDALAKIEETRNEMAAADAARKKAESLRTRR